MMTMRFTSVSLLQLFLFTTCPEDVYGEACGPGAPWKTEWLHDQQLAVPEGLHHPASKTPPPAQPDIRPTKKSL